MPTKVQSLKLYILPGHMANQAPLGTPVNPQSAFILAHAWNFSDRPMMLSLSEDGAQVNIHFEKPFKASWWQRLLRIKSYIRFSVVDPNSQAAVVTDVKGN